MTSAEMYQRTLELLNKEHTGTIYPEEFDIFINIAQEAWLKNRYAEVGLTEKRIDDLREVKVILPGIAPVAQNTFDLPGDYLFMLAAAFRLQYFNSTDPCVEDGTISDIEIIGTPARSDQKYVQIYDPWSKPNNWRLYYDQVGTQIKLITGTDSIAQSATFEYLREPAAIQVTGVPVDCELSRETHQEIVDLCVRKVLEVIESGRYQTFLVENKSTIV
tara:strand:+ start:2946 stop:3599 length:654 start_codon:yes stop_codon:yes gene_type:complete